MFWIIIELINCISGKLSLQNFAKCNTRGRVKILQTISYLHGLTQFFDFMMVQICTFSRNLEFWSFHKLIICNMIFSHDAGQCPWAGVPSQPQDHESKPPICLQQFCTQTTRLFFTFSIVFNKLHEIFNTLS